MKSKNITNTTILLLFVLGILTGCAEKYIPSEAEMLPSTEGKSYFTTEKILKLHEVTGGEVATNPWVLVSKIEPKDFEKVLHDALVNSGIFRQIINEGPADYELRTKIISQEVKPGLQVDAILFVRYSLYETTTNQIIWQESLVSQHVSEFEEGFDGGIRQKFANEGAVKDNLMQLLNKISNTLSQINNK